MSYRLCSFVFGAKGAALISSLGQRPREMVRAKCSAEGAIHFPSIF